MNKDQIDLDYLPPEGKPITLVIIILTVLVVGFICGGLALLAMSNKVIGRWR